MAASPPAEGGALLVLRCGCSLALASAQQDYAPRLLSPPAASAAPPPPAALSADTSSVPASAMPQPIHTFLLGLELESAVASSGVSRAVA